MSRRPGALFEIKKEFADSKFRAHFCVYNKNCILLSFPGCTSGLSSDSFWFLWFQGFVTFDENVVGNIG